MASKRRSKQATEALHFEGREPAGLGEAMHHLAQQIIEGFETRADKRAALRQEAAGWLRDFRRGMHTVREELGHKARDLRRFLDTTTSARMRDFRALRQAIRTDQEARRREREARSREVAGLLSGFGQDRGAAAHHWQGMAFTIAKKRAGFAR